LDERDERRKRDTGCLIKKRLPAGLLVSKAFIIGLSIVLNARGCAQIAWCKICGRLFFQGWRTGGRVRGRRGWNRRHHGFTASRTDRNTSLIAAAPGLLNVFLPAAITLRAGR
jgi:hypothetical protein